MSILNNESLRTKFLFWGCVLLIWAGVVVGTLWHHGYQRSPSRSFTKEEMIQIAAQRAMQRMLSNPPDCVRPPSEDGQWWDSESFRPAFVVPYRDVEHLMTENPGCCYIDRTIYNHASVQVNLFYKDKTGEIHSCKNQRMFSSDFFPSGIRYMP